MLSFMTRDETYIIDLCDQQLGSKALRQHRFDFLLGDPGKNGIGRRLPVDAYYPELKLVIEYREIQHTKPVAFMDRRPTISGCTRGEQRQRYDERRRLELPRHGLRLIELDCGCFRTGNRGRLRRDFLSDEAILRSHLAIALTNALGRT